MLSNTLRRISASRATLTTVRRRRASGERGGVGTAMVKSIFDHDVPQHVPNGFSIVYLVLGTAIIPTFAYVGQQIAVEVVYHCNEIGWHP
mmetsp:Transcript_17316/g.45189  ORF Transcript_17316/g.45189 Transcript_17316/m.45189 type:complete len:90 (+) Transcript_17316:184-453(+)